MPILKTRRFFWHRSVRPAFSFGGVPKHPGIDSLIFEAKYELEKEFSIDTTRRYVIGESLGGYGTWHFITRRPRMFAAAVPVCGVVVSVILHWRTAS